MAQKRTTEAEIAEAVLRILVEMPNGEASTPQLRKNIEKYIALSEGDQKDSDTRKNEALWEQIVRNIVSHKAVPGNIIKEGFANSPSRGRLRITEAGRLHVKNKFG